MHVRAKKRMNGVAWGIGWGGRAIDGEIRKHGGFEGEKSGDGKRMIVERSGGKHV